MKRKGISAKSGYEALQKIERRQNITEMRIHRENAQSVRDPAAGVGSRASTGDVERDYDLLEEAGKPTEGTSPNENQNKHANYQWAMSTDPPQLGGGQR